MSTDWHLETSPVWKTQTCHGHGMAGFTHAVPMRSHRDRMRILWGLNGDSMGSPRGTRDIIFRQGSEPIRPYKSPQKTQHHVNCPPIPWYPHTIGTMVPWYHATMGTMGSIGTMATTLPWYQGTMVPWYHEFRTLLGRPEADLHGGSGGRR